MPGGYEEVKARRGWGWGGHGERTGQGVAREDSEGHRMKDASRKKYF